MGTIEIISASAGSGKTHKLATLIQEEIREGRVRPEAVLATTFTNRAAAELQERVRKYLLQADLVDPAQRILTARFGTVNSVCGRLLSEFAFELGLSPALKVIDEDRAKHLLKQALDGAPEQEGLVEELSRRWDFFKPAGPNRDTEDKNFFDVLQKVVDFARANRIPPEALSRCASRSFEGFARLLAPLTAAPQNLERELCQKIEWFAGQVRAASDETKGTARVVDFANRLAYRLGQGQDIPWNDWVKLETEEVTKKSKGAFAEVQKLAAGHLGHPKFREDIRRIIGLLFDVARRGLERYQEQKAQKGLIDFTDQETFALRLLENDLVRRRLKSQIDLVVVDEFQDTSPLQLAIFLRFAQIAKRSVWVGDQKQAIYGFRGTDPLLMDAAMKPILKGREPETLGFSYRSRPELVRLTSAIFAPAFGKQKIPENRVVLEPCIDDEPPGLGPIIERWVTSGPKPLQADCIATGVDGLLAGGRTLVRDVVTKEARPARAGDIAVLCRSNAECQEVAAALEAIGLRVARERSGLFDTHEGCLVLSGLRLWIDPHDRLAGAEVERLVDHADNPDLWLAGLLQRKKDKANLSCAALERLEKAREKEPLAGALTAFDLVCEALEVRLLCLAWGDTEARLANLEALRELAVRYVEDGAIVPGGASPGGLLASFEQAGEEGGAEKPALVDEQAVVVSTWHSAKGLEWPIVILHGIASGRKAEPYSERVLSDAKEIDLSNPLEGRWIRFWPFPYNSRRSSGTLVERVAADEEMTRAEDRDERERLRVLYVVWTRAGDRLILACKENELMNGNLGLLNRSEEILHEPDEGGCEWAGRKVDLVVKHLAPMEKKERKQEASTGYPPAERVEHPPAWVSPSKQNIEGEEGRLGEAVSIGKGIPLQGSPEKTNLGNAVHGFLAADRPGMDARERRKMADGLLKRWNVGAALKVEDLLRAADAFQAWIGITWPKARMLREMPIELRLQDGSVVRGSCDLALETGSGWVVIDHKSFPGSPNEAGNRAGEYAPQLTAYAQAIEAATKKKVIGMYVHMPMMGLVLPVLPGK